VAYAIALACLAVVSGLPGGGQWPVPVGRLFARDSCSRSKL